MRYLILILLVPLRGIALPLLTNGSFESPALTSTLNLSGPFTLPGWTGQGPSNGGNAGLVVGPNNGLTPADSQQHFTFNGGNPSDQGYLEQTLPTTAGAAYEVTFALGRAGGGQSLSLMLTLFDVASPITAQSFHPPPTTGYQYHTLAFTAPSTTTTLLFTDTSGPNSISDLYIDNIAVAPAGSVGVPDHGPSLLLLSALCALVLKFRRL
jgi:hypothetical protein